jgi:hypothetical protein
MLKTERIAVMNLENAMRGARNPLNSWARSDSYYNEKGEYILGPNDLDLAKRLRNAGSDHRKYLRQIFVSMDITAPLYWWKEFDTYKVGTVANSCSTMHTIHKRELTMEDFSCEHLMTTEKQMLNVLINLLNEDIMVYNADTNQKAFWWQIDQQTRLLPKNWKCYLEN